MAPNLGSFSGRPQVFQLAAALLPVPGIPHSSIAQLTKDNMKAVDDKTLEVKLPKTVSPQVFLSINGSASLASGP